MIKILAIGNSFSEDATYYLHQIAKASHVETFVVNLYIGGCSLERHWRNIESGESAYQKQVNGVITEKYVSILEELRSQEWDYIVTQQCSHDSGWENTYEPFIGLIVDYLYHNSPNSKIFLHKTWAYDPDSTHEHFMRYHRSQDEMYHRLSECYEKVSNAYHLPLIPCADIIQKLRKTDHFNMSKGGSSLCRDAFHMHYIYGRYALACTWAQTLLGISIEENSYVPKTDFLPDETADEAILKIIRTVITSFA